MRRITIALAGQANVGKSVIFNQLTGLHQHIGNWPGKTVERAEGTLFYRGYLIDVVDLPGIYSFSHYSLEELVSREFIAEERPDVVVNVVDATALERHLIFTLQLLELERPLVLVLNMMDLAERRGIQIDLEGLGRILDVPVVATIATRGKGIHQILDKVIELIEEGREPRRIEYGREVEERVRELMGALEGVESPYPVRWLAIKLLEKDEEVWRIIEEVRPEAVKLAERLISELEEMHGHDSGIVIANERACLANQIARQVTRMISERRGADLGERFDAIATHPIIGYLLMMAIFAGLFAAVFWLGGYVSGFFEDLSEALGDAWLSTLGAGIPQSVGWAVVEGLLFLLGLAIPYIAPLYFLLFLLENWGYIARVSFLMENIMHKAGTHGKACIPMILGFGCNVPACLSARIMETHRERLITVFMTTLAPCSATTVVVMGLVGRYLGISWVLGLYFLVLAAALLLGRLASKILPGEPMELIMEMPSYKIPNLKIVSIMTWIRLREFIYVAMPIIVATGAAIKLLESMGILELISEVLSPVTVHWLGLPRETGILLILGVLRKELILLTLASLLGTTDFSRALTPNQMITLSLVTLFYIPCVATMAALTREIGGRGMLIIAAAEVGLALAVGGIASRLLMLFGIR